MPKRTAKVDHSKIDHEQLKQVMEKRKSFLIPINKIHPNSFNKNRMGVQYYAALKAGIADPRIGILKPILIRNDPTKSGEYEIVDGEHRWKAATEVGYTEVPVINLDDLPEAWAKFLMIESNQVHGETPDEEVKRILVEAKKDMEDEDLDLWAMAVVDEPIEDSEKYGLDDEEFNVGGSDIEPTSQINLFFTEEQITKWRRIIGQLRLTDGRSQEEAVMQCIEFFEESTGFGEKTGDDILDHKQRDLVND